MSDPGSNSVVLELGLGLAYGSVEMDRTTGQDMAGSVKGSLSSLYGALPVRVHYMAMFGLYWG